MNKNLNEGLEYGDLKRLVHPSLHIDEFRSKMGKDQDVIVLSFKVASKEPALDLVNFMERGYEWVIDADVSSGEMDDGDYIVFVECDREPSAASNIMEMMEELMNLTEQKISDWHVKFHGTDVSHELSVDSIKNNIPLTSDDYDRRYGKKELDEMRAAAGVTITTTAPKNDYTQALRSLAGIL